MRPGDLETLGPIQVVPPGLMGILQLKQTGTLPGWLAQSVQPIIELRDWYFQARRVDEQTLFGSLPVTSPNLATGSIGIKSFVTLVGNNPCQVPQNQTWFVENMTVFGATAAAADSLSFACGIEAPQGSFEQLGNVFIDQLAGARQRTMFAYNNRAFWAGPGDVFAVLVTDVVSAGIQAQCRLRATVLPI